MATTTGTTVQPTQVVETPILESQAAVLGNLSRDPTGYQLYEVDWQLGEDEWIEIDHDSSIYTEAKIWRYKLYERTGHNIYKYRLEFSNLKHHDYAFQFGSEDWQTKSTYRDSDYTIDYNAEEPNIIQVGWKV